MIPFIPLKLETKPMMRKFKIQNVIIFLLKRNNPSAVFFKIDPTFFEFFEKCKNPAHIAKMAEKGSLLIVSLLCEDNDDTCWYSQPLLHDTCWYS